MLDCMNREKKITFIHDSIYNTITPVWLTFEEPFETYNGYYSLRM